MVLEVLKLNSLEEIKGRIKEADMILLGIGEELHIDEDRILEQSSLYAEWKEKGEWNSLKEQRFIRSSLYLEELKSQKNSAVQESLERYRQLYQLVKGKNYFVVTMCNDDIIRLSEFEKGRVVSPCGTRHKMQCSGKCTEEVCDTGEITGKIKEQIAEMNRAEVPVCPHCKEQMSMNLITEEGYSEQGYLEDWKRYHMWLSGTLNKNLCILELGVGFACPSVIRWPFEKIAALNNKAGFIRVNAVFPQIASEIKEKSFSVKMGSSDFIRTIAG